MVHFDTVNEHLSYNISGVNRGEVRTRAQLIEFRIARKLAFDEIKAAHHGKEPKNQDWNDKDWMSLLADIKQEDKAYFELHPVTSTKKRKEKAKTTEQIPVQEAIPQTELIPINEHPVEIPQTSDTKPEVLVRHESEPRDTETARRVKSDLTQRLVRLSQETGGLNRDLSHLYHIANRKYTDPNLIPLSIFTLGLFTDMLTSSISAYSVTPPHHDLEWIPFAVGTLAAGGARVVINGFQAHLASKARRIRPEIQQREKEMDEIRRKIEST